MFLEYIMGLNMKGVGMQMAGDHFLMSSKVLKYMCQLMESSFKALPTEHDIICNIKQEPLSK